METIYITGHQNPDTDSICSSIAYAYLKNTINKDNSKQYLPMRLGNVSKETQFVLDYFKIKEPDLLDSLFLKVKDLDYVPVKPIKHTTTIKEARLLLNENGTKAICVSKNNKLQGVITSSNLDSVYNYDLFNNNILSESKTRLEDLVDVLNATIMTKNENYKYLTGKVLIAAMEHDSVVKMFNENDIAILGDRSNIQELLIDKKLGVIIITGEFTIKDELIKKAYDNGVTIINTPYDTLKTSRLILESIPVDYVVSNNNIEFVYENDNVHSVKNKLMDNRYRAYPVLDDDNNVLGMLNRFSLLSKRKKQIIQVDHNEAVQSVNGIEEAEIVEIVDHHRIGSITSPAPMFVRVETVGCTATIITKLFEENNVVIPKEIAGIMLSAILSDTLIFKSPTCTNDDILAANMLAKIAGIIDITKFGIEMIKASTSLVGMTSEKIFNADFKCIPMNGYNIGISQINTLDISGFIENQMEEMIKYMDNLIETNSFDLLVLALTDIVNEGSELITRGSISYTIEKAFNIKLLNNHAYAKGVLSRKKQIVPQITDALSE